MEQSDNKGITIKKAEDFSEWYTQVLQKADLIDYSDVSGCYVLKPKAYAIWETIQEFFNKKIKAIGVRNSYFPLFIPESLLEKEEKHLAGFKAEVAWVTQGGDTKLSERLAIRPTSETIMYSHYAKWIRNYKDLPLKLNQWCNVVRWEFKHPVPFLRSREFLWQEGHSVFASAKEDDKDTLQVLDFYEEVYNELLAIPVIKGRKTESEKFPGANYTLSAEVLVENGKAMQGATSHNLGQNFSKAFGIRFLNEAGKTEYAYQNSWGLSTRAIGACIMIHSDDSGLVLPPKVAENKVVIIPIFFDETKEEVAKKAKKIEEELKEFNPILDDREEYTPGWKFNEWELNGIPIRIELGPKDLEKEQVVLVTRHDGKKNFVKFKDLKNEVSLNLERMQKELLEKAKHNLRSNIKEVLDMKEFEKAINDRKIAKISWCNNLKCEEEIKNKINGVKSLCIPLDEKEPIGEKCVNCSEEAKVVCLFGRSY